MLLEEVGGSAAALRRGARRELRGRVRSPSAAAIPAFSTASATSSRTRWISPEASANRTRAGTQRRVEVPSGTTGRDFRPRSCTGWASPTSRRAGAAAGRNRRRDREWAWGCSSPRRFWSAPAPSWRWPMARPGLRAQWRPWRGREPRSSGGSSASRHPGVSEIRLNAIRQVNQPAPSDVRPVEVRSMLDNVSPAPAVATASSRDQSLLIVDDDRPFLPASRGPWRARLCRKHRRNSAGRYRRDPPRIRPPSP